MGTRRRSASVMPARVIKAAADVSPIDAFGGKATREHRIRVRSQQSERLPATVGAAGHFEGLAAHQIGGVPGTPRRLMALAKLHAHAPLADQRDILWRKERENEAIVQRSKTATRRSRNKEA